MIVSYITSGWDMIQVEIMARKKRSEHYVNNKEFLDALIKYREKLEIAKIQGTKKPPVPSYIGECFLKMATHYSFKPNFVNYMFKEDMISDGIENCLHRSTIVPTIEYGPIEIEKLVGKEITVRCKDGKWRKAYGKSYGKQMLYEYGFSSFNVPTKDVTQKVIATENHRWYLNNIEDAIDDLSVGDIIQNAPLEKNYDVQSIIHGLQCGENDNIEKCNSLQIDPTYIYGFIFGWLLANDNDLFDENKKLKIVTNDAGKDWLLRYAPYSGYHVIGFEKNQNQMNDVFLMDPQYYSPVVRYIKEYGEDEVFCLEEPETNSFILGNGLLTGNCLQYIHNFNPEKSQNPFAYFTQIIHFAFLRRIQREKKQMEIKNKILEKSGYNSVFDDDGGVDGSNYSDYNTIKDNVHNKLRY